MPADEMTDRQLLEQIARRTQETRDMVNTLTAVLDEFRPLLAVIKGANGKPDMIGVLQARREARRAARSGP
jgi:hypothetical protein